VTRMTWTRRHLPLPSDWKARRRQTAERAGWRCEGETAAGTRCPEGGHFCDHVVNTRSMEGVAMGERVHALGNLQWLCKSCHDKKTASEAAASRHTNRLLGRHPGERSHYSYR